MSTNIKVPFLVARLPDTKGKEPKQNKYCGGTIFVDGASGFIFVSHQITLNAGETVRSKRAWESYAADFGINIKSYHCDNFPFNSEEFKADLAAKHQTMSNSGTGAHHQNGVAERAIKTVSAWARAMLLNMIIHWPDKADVSLWPFAMDHAVYIWNHLPRKDSLLAPIEIFSSVKFSSYSHLQRLHVWGCPVYVLDPKLQDGRKLPKWDPRARRGQYLGVSTTHSTTIGRILNLRTGHVSPQYHVVYDDLFTTVPNAESGGIVQDTTFNQDMWSKLIKCGVERAIDEDFNEEGNRVQHMPELHEDWLTPMEIL